MTNEAECRLACEIENEFLCRSFLYKGPPIGAQYNCQLFHLDHKTLPDGPSTYLNAERPLIDDGQRIGSYYENYCESKFEIILIRQFSCTININETEHRARLLELEIDLTLVSWVQDLYSQVKFSTLVKIILVILWRMMYLIHH